MNTAEYQRRLAAALDASRESRHAISQLMTDIGENAGTAEWNFLYSLSRLAGVITDELSEAAYPHNYPSAVDADVPMACVACRKPVEATRRPPGGWQHAAEDDAIGCPALGSPVVAMVAADAATEDEAGAAMICTVCLQPIYQASTTAWVHAGIGTETVDCARLRGPMTAIKAMPAGSGWFAADADGITHDG